MNNLFGEGPSGAKGGAAYSAAVCLYIVVSLVVSLIIQGAQLTGDAAAYLSCICSPLAILIFLFVCGTLIKTPVRTAAPLACKPEYYLIAVLAVFGLTFAVSPLNSLITEFMAELGYDFSSELPSMQGWGMVGSLIALAVLPAVFEELLFRGVILSNLNGSVGTYRAVFLTGFVFCLYHGSAAQTLYQFVCGCLFALLAVKSGSVLPSMLAHFINNALIIIVNGLSLLDESGNIAMPQWAFILITVLAALSLAASLALLIFDKRQVRGRKGEVSQFFIWGGAGIFVMALVWVLGFVQI